MPPRPFHPDAGFQGAGPGATDALPLVTPLLISKVNTVLQLATVAAALRHPTLGASSGLGLGSLGVGLGAGLPAGSVEGLAALASLTTVASTAAYWRAYWRGDILSRDGRRRGLGL